MNIYKDYGAVQGNPIPSITFPNVRRSQVWYATHRGEEILPYRNRSFISFSFGGKWIEEFDLIACCKGNTMQRKAYADFENLTTSYDIMDGQYYHGTHYKPNTLSLELATDGIDQQKFDEFLNWFAGGKTRELVLAEHPNRAIMARVSSAPQIDMIPFEHPITVTINSVEYTTSTTLYKGTISLDLVADTPFWYAKQNILIQNENTNKGIFSNVLLSTDNADLFKEAVKIVYEDTVPMNGMVSYSMHFGEDKYATVGEDVPYTCIVAEATEAEIEDWATYSLKPGYFKIDDAYYKGARIDGIVGANTYLGRIAGAFMVNEVNSEISIPYANDAQDYFLFYGGTAPSPVTISFKIGLYSPNGYINCIANSYAPNASDGTEYSTITLESVHKKTFDFTTPNIITSWNKAYSLFNSISTTDTNWADFTDTLRDYIRHPAVRSFAIQIVNYLNSSAINVNNVYFSSSGVFTSEGKSKAIAILNKFFRDRNGEVQTAEFIFNSELGTAIGKIHYWQHTSSNTSIVSILASDHISQSNQNKYFKEHEEDVGDMLRSNWLFLEDHNKFVDNQYVKEWTAISPTNAHKVTHNAQAPLIDLKFSYKNMYL